jgi:hypothetical protein
VITATAPAQEVVVIDQLDPNLDWTTFQPQAVAFGSQTLTLLRETADLGANLHPLVATLVQDERRPRAAERLLPVGSSAAGWFGRVNGLYILCVGQLGGTFGFSLDWTVS